MTHKYKALYTDFHTNIHPSQLDEFDRWYDHAQNVIDFWLIAYYPYEKFEFGRGLKSEREISQARYKEQWELIRKRIKEMNHDNPDFPMFLGFEWQGAGLDGDHNVFFKEDGEMHLPRRYTDLAQSYEGQDVIGIPHHLAYAKGHRGKNWDTHIEWFSPFAEIKSQHGSSEYGVTDMAMDRHIHMGPRTGGTSVFDGLNKGHKVGIVASGDNHVVPADQVNGIAGVWAVENTKDAIWDAIQNKRVFGCTNNRISLWFDINGSPMGSTVVDENQDLIAHIEVLGNSKIKHVELIKNGSINAIDFNGSPKVRNKEAIKFKSKFEFGWGPNVEVYPDITSRNWDITINTEAKILHLEPSFSNFDQKIVSQNDHEVVLNLHTYKTSHTGKWMGKSPIVSEGFIIEFEGKETDRVDITINGTTYHKTVGDILDNTDLIVELDDAYKLAKERFDVDGDYRSDSFYHNAYKTRINEGFTDNQYNTSFDFALEDADAKGWYVAKVYQQDGQVAWSSPIWVE